ncbi:S-adenosyl-L-methionine dependent methyltransferase [Daedalea quercina L-15889]|uniref:S-adenosyl-L-methionine dependent methyltransferase n=1 Tax=Daedalea quercina L-15889 TaxID=1314783 RepID=A0A165MSW0_9APHY|nr:S-adenosyl-L-methionine dependent methyltransferase [Daedalea quercina L-15889]
MQALHPSARAYSFPLILRTYDFWVLYVTNNWIWRCRTRSVLLPFYEKHIGESAHLDVGVGTGYLPANAIERLAKTKKIALLDLNADTLETSEARIRRAGYKGVIEKVNQSAFDPLPESLQGKFDSISTFYMLHCLPGSFPAKASRVFASLKAGLAPGGVFYGSTVLAKDVQHNWAGRILTWLYNRMGSFANRGDGLDDLKKALKEHFEDVEVTLVGVVALFVAKNPVQKP